MTSPCLAQTVSIKIKYLLDGDERKVHKLAVSASDSTGTDRVQVKRDRLQILNSNFGRRVTLEVKINGQEELVFHRVPIAWNKEHLEWEIFVDRGPFDKDRWWHVSDWSQVKSMLYYLDYGNGKQVTEYR